MTKELARDKAQLGQIFAAFGLTVTDIGPVMAELKAKGVVITTALMTIRAEMLGCFIQGPQGISIEVLQHEMGA